jgi:hypothetical protein
MTKTNNRNIRHFASSSFIITGMLLSMLGSREAIHAQMLTEKVGQGMTLSQISAEEGLHAAALMQAQASISAMQIVVGMLLVLLGLAIHTLLFIRNERPSHKKSKIKQMDIFQLEIWS